MKILIIGAGSTAVSISEIIYGDKIFQITGYIGITEENKSKIGKDIFRNFKYLGDKSILKLIDKENASGFVVGIGDRYLRELSYYEVLKSEKIPVEIISKDSKISDNVEIKTGSVIFPNALISHNVTIGENTFIESGVIIEPNCYIGSNCNIEAGSIISGNSVIKKNTTIGKNSVIGSNLIIGKNRIVKPNNFIDSNLEDFERKQVAE